VLAADIGGTAVGAGVVLEGGEIRVAAEAATRGGGAGSVLDTVLGLLEETRARALAEGLALVGCGIGVPGAVDVAAGRIGRDIQNLPELAGCPLAALAAARTGLPTVIDNDVNALALGEARFGVARGLRSFVLLALGTGVGGGVYVDGDLVRGVSGYGGELGHWSVSLDGRPCICGARGCLKAYVAGPDIVAQAREGLGRHPDSSLAGRDGAEALLSARDVFESAAAGDPLAAEVVERVCQALGAGLGGILNGLNPEAIILTGGVARSLESRLDTVRGWARSYALPGAWEAARIVVARLDKTTSVRGPAALFLHEAARRPELRPHH